MKPTETHPFAKILGYFIALPIMALLLMWYNHVWTQWHVAYWQWLCLAVPLALVAKSPLIKWPFGAIFIGALLFQVASWIGLMALPLIKL